MLLISLYLRRGPIPGARRGSLVRSPPCLTRLPAWTMQAPDRPDSPDFGRPASRRHYATVAPAFEQLHLIERRVRAVFACQQLVVLPHFDDAAALEHDDRVGAPDRREAMRDDERRPIHHQVRKRLLDEQLRF